MVQDLGVLEEFLKVWGCWALVNTASRLVLQGYVRVFQDVFRV